MGKNEQIGRLDPNKVYSSYYSRACRIVPDSKLVAISLGIPNGFKGVTCRELNPPVGLIVRYKANEISDKEYEQVYREEVLRGLNPLKIYEQLKGKVILCYCGKGAFCHRNIVMKWLEESIGEHIIGEEI